MGEKVRLIAEYWTVAGDVVPGGSSEVSPISLRERAEAAAWAGYRGMGLLHVDLMAEKTRSGLKGIKSIFDDNGLTDFEVEFLTNWFEEGNAKRQASDKVKHDLLEIASLIGARSMKVSPVINTSHCDVSQYADAFAVICEDAKQSGIDVALEFMPFANVSSLQIARQIVEGAGCENGGLCLDTWHLSRGGTLPAEVAELPAAYIKSVEISDAATSIIGDLWHDTANHRLQIGEGSMDVAGYVSAVRFAGFDSFFSVAVLNKDYRKLPVREQAKRSFDAATAFFTNQVSQT